MNDSIYSMETIAILKQEYYKIFLINLTNFTYMDLDIDSDNNFKDNDLKDLYSTCLNDYTLIANEFNTFDINAIKDHFSKSDQKISFRLQKKNNNGISWLSANVYKSLDYSSDNQTLIMLIRYIDDEYHDLILKQQELEELSYTDNLTNMGNRRAFDNFINSSKRHIGIVFIDINGLKQINDIKGHNYGDKLIKQCSDLLVNNFRKSDCYRIGGDEFIIALEGITEEVLLEKIKIIRQESKNRNISISIGYKWDIGENIEQIVNQAEEAMRQDKNEYYKSHQKYR